MASRRQYLSQAELAKYADITIIDSVEADDQISQAEELIDAYVGPQDQFLSRSFDDIEGLISGGVGSSTFQLESRHQNVFQNNFFSYTEVEIIGGLGAGQRHQVLSNTYAGIITIVDTFSPAIDVTSFYRLYQLGRFPRQKDSYFDGIHTPLQYYKNIPEEIKRATAAQVQYMIKMGTSFFASDDIFKNAEHIGDYSYAKSRGGSGDGLPQLLAPKAKSFLRGYVNRKGIFLT